MYGVTSNFCLKSRSAFKHYNLGDATGKGVEPLGEFNTREEAISAMDTAPAYMNSIHILPDSICVFETSMDGYRSDHTMVCYSFTVQGAEMFDTFEEAKAYALKWISRKE